MTVVVAFLCDDGVVIAADSMITPTFSGMGVGHHTGRKAYTLDGNQILGWAGDLGLAMRFKSLVDQHPASGRSDASALDYALAVSQTIVEQFKNTGVLNAESTNCVLGLIHGDMPHCCAFFGNFQPFLLDEDHYYVALGSGKLSADPFLRFLVDTFSEARRPTVREAVFLATWTVQHAIDTTQGGVAEPIRICVIERKGGMYSARELPETEIGEHLQAISSAQDALRTWRDSIQSGAAAGSAPPTPVPPPMPAVGKQ